MYIYFIYLIYSVCVQNTKVKYIVIYNKKNLGLRKSLDLISTNFKGICRKSYCIKANYRIYKSAVLEKMNIIIIVSLTDYSVKKNMMYILP